jgi:hypothetical protein
MFEIELARMAEAEADVDEMQSLLERLMMSVKANGRFATSRQMDNVYACKRLLRSALEAQAPNVGDVPLGTDRSDPVWASKAWVDKRIYSLEDALRGKGREEVHAIEEGAVMLLIENTPEWAWEEHQTVLAQRVRYRARRKRVHADLHGLPEMVGERFLEFGDFRVGDANLKGFVHQFSAVDEVKVLADDGSEMCRAYVCHETKVFVDVIDWVGEKLRKKKRRVQRVVTYPRERIVDREVLELGA